MTFARVVFWIAAIYGVAVIFPMYFTEANLNTQNPPALTHPEYYYSFLGVTLAWQVLFIVIAITPGRFRVIMLPCALEKLSLIPTFLILNPQGRFPQLWVAPAIVDVLLAILFTVAFFKARPKNQKTGSKTDINGAVAPG
jgi:hypothetical protein